MANAPKSKLTTAHYEPQVAPALRWLTPAAFVYGVGVWARGMGYQWGLIRKTTLPCPVISIGNLTTGGTGKTPVVAALAQGLTQTGARVVILSRGYGAQTPTDYHTADSPQYGDEPYLLQQLCPEAMVVVGPKRWQTAQRAYEEFKPDVVLLDDGFQHVRLNRHYDIVLVDGEKGFGNEQLLPVGPLREPLSALKRAHQIWVTRPNEIPPRFHYQLPSDIPVEYVPIEPTALRSFPPPDQNPIAFPLETFYSLYGSRPVLLVSGIAHPQRFEEQVKPWVGNIVDHITFEDHAVFTETDVRAIASRCSMDTLVITTEKDRVKWEQILPPKALNQWYSLSIEAKLPPAAIHLLQRLFTPPSAARPPEEALR